MKNINDGEWYPCACMGPTGDDPYCRCEMRRRGLTPTPLWTPEAREELKKALQRVMEIEDEMLNQSKD